MTFEYPGPMARFPTLNWLYPQEGEGNIQGCQVTKLRQCLAVSQPHGLSQHLHAEMSLSQLHRDPFMSLQLWCW